ncbi:MAG: lipocalin family protein [Bacteroidota bacterium]
MKNCIFFMPLFLTLTGCDKWKSEDLVGKWQAIYIAEEGKELDIDYTPVNFQFNSNGFYEFNSTIEYKEVGTYFLNGNLLYTLDTLNSASSEKAVKITMLTSDSLYLNMMANGKDKLMKLYRVE